MNNEIVLFEMQDKSITLPVQMNSNTVYLSANQMAALFDKDEKTIRKHINNVFAEGELIRENNTQKMRVVGVKQRVPFYTLDVIISVGYRVKSQRGVEFRRWANAVLRQYILDGYAVNQKRLAALQKTVKIQTKMLANALEIEEAELLRAVKLYTDALMMLDQYDHQALVKPIGSASIYRLTVEDCRKMITHMESNFHSAVFGVEKEPGKVEGILAAVYQNVFGQESIRRQRRKQQICCIL